MIQKKKVSRETELEVLMEIIKNKEDYQENSRNGLVILLNGAWGSGKSTFLKEVEEKINSNEDFDLFINYDAYEYDFYDTPYIPFFSSIEEKLQLGKELEKLMKVTAKDIGKLSLAIAYELVKKRVEDKYNIDVDNIRDNVMGMSNTNYLEDFKEFQKCKMEIQKKLREYCKNKTQVFIVDELDRCKPNFAIDTLEIIKHFFDVENCVFIIAVDKLQLQESAKTIFGQEMDSEKYFSKFYDYQFNLLSIPFYETINVENIYQLPVLVKEISKLFQELNISLRDSYKIFNEFVSRYKRYYNADETLSWTKEQCYLIVFLLILKYTDLLFYKEIMKGNFERHVQKLKEEYSNSSNNYLTVLRKKISENTTYETVLKYLSNYINDIYINIDDAFVQYFGFSGEAKYKTTQLKAQKLYEYLPQTLPEKTFRENVENIIN